MQDRANHAKVKYRTDLGTAANSAYSGCADSTLEGNCHNMQSSLRILLAICADLCINSAILMVTYPIWREFQYQRYPGSYWLRTYLLAGFISTLIVLLIAFIIAGIWKTGSGKRLFIAQIVVTFIVLSVVGISSDFSSPFAHSSWPQMLQLIAAKFFAELQSLRFMTLTASSISITSGVMLWFAVLAPRKAGNC